MTRLDPSGHSPDPPRSGAGCVGAGNDVLAFVVEIGALGALAWWAASLSNHLVVQVALALAMVALFGVTWGRRLAPRATHRLPLPRRVVAKAVIFAVAAGALAETGHPRLGIVLAGLAAVHLGLVVALARRGTPGRAG